MALAKICGVEWFEQEFGQLEVILRFALSQPYAAKVEHERREI